MFLDKKKYGEIPHIKSEKHSTTRVNGVECFPKKFF